jgi:hypothetical protein
VLQPAYDSARPNGAARRHPGDHVIYIFRLYRKLNTGALAQPPPSSSAIAKEVDAIRQRIAKWRKFLQSNILALEGRILEQEIRLPLIIERVQEVPEVRASLRYTRGGYFLDLPCRSAKGFTHWRITGTSFWHTTTIDGVAVDGDSALKSLQDLISDYLYPPVGSGRTAADYELYWFNLNAPRSASDPIGETEWLIFPARNAVRTLQVAERPFLRNFEFEFTGLLSNRDRAKAEDGFLAGLLSGDFLRKVLHDLGLDSVRSILNDIFGTVSDVQNFLEDVANVASAASDFVNGIRQTIQASIGKVAGLLTATTTFIGRLEDAWNLLKSLPDLASDQLNGLLRDFPGLLGDSAATDKALRGCRELRRVRDFLLTLAMQPQNFTDPIVVGQIQNIAQQVAPGQTLQSIAAAAGVDPQVLVATNKLHYPFVDSRPRPESQAAAQKAERDRLAARIAPASSPDEAAADPHLADSILALQQAGVAADDPTLVNLLQQLADLQGRYDRADGYYHGYQDASSNLPSAVAANRSAAYQAAYAQGYASGAAPALDGVLYAGDTIQIPQPSSTDTPPGIFEISPALATRIAGLTGSPVTDEDRRFGLDLMLTGDGNLVWDSLRGDLSLERALQHMANVQVRYVMLRPGDLRYAPGLGNLAWAELGRWQGPGRSEMVAYQLARTLASDPRVKEVRNVRYSQSRGRAQLLHDITLIDGVERTDLQVPL